MIEFSLDKLMTERNLSIQDVVNATGITRPTISQLTNGKAKGVQFDTLNKLVLGLGISVDELFDDVYPEKDLRYTIDITKVSRLNIGNSDEPSIFVTLIYQENIHDEDAISSFKMPLNVSFNSTNSSAENVSSDTITFSCLSDVLTSQEIPKMSQLRLKDFFNSTPVAKLEQILGYIAKDCLTELALPNKYDFVVFQSDVSNVYSETWSTVFSWDTSLLTNEQKFNQFLNIKYQY